MSDLDDLFAAFTERINDLKESKLKMTLRAPKRLDEIEDHNFRNLLSQLYENKTGGRIGSYLRVFATILNTAYAEKRPTFLLSEPLLNELIAKDPNLVNDEKSQGSFSGTTFSNFIGYCIHTKLLVKRWAAQNASKEASVFSVLASETVTGIFHHLMGQEQTTEADRVVINFASKKKPKKKKQGGNSNTPPDNLSSNLSNTTSSDLSTTSSCPPSPTLPSDPTSPTTPAESSTSLITTSSTTPNVFPKDSSPEDGNSLLTSCREAILLLPEDERDLFIRIFNEISDLMDRSEERFDPVGGQLIDIPALFMKRVYTTGPSSIKDYDHLKTFVALNFLEQLKKFDFDIRNWSDGEKFMQDVVWDTTYGTDRFGCFPTETCFYLLEKRFLTNPPANELKRIKFEEIVKQYKAMFQKRVDDRSKIFGVFLRFHRYNYISVNVKDGI